MTVKNRSALCRALAAVIAFATGATAFAQNYETLGNLKAAEFAPAELLKGPYHTVDELITVAGAQPNFMIRSPYGTWEARGREMLVIRVSELPAFEQLAKVSKSDEFLKSAGAAVAAPVEMVGDLVTSPVQTTEHIFSGIGLMASRLGSVVGQTVNRVGDTVSGDTKAQAPILKPVAPPLGTAPPRQIIGGPLGYNQQRREWAKRLSVDPYTFNGSLSDKIGDVAAVTFTASFPVNLVLGSVIAPLYYAQQINEAATLEAYNLPPLDIENQNTARLKAMGIEGLPVRTLMRNKFFTPTLQSAFVLSLQSLGNVQGLGAVVDFATRAASEVEVRYVNNSVMLLAQYGRSVGPLASVRSAGNVIAAQTADGKLIVPAPLDYVPWVAQVDFLARRTDLAGAQRSLLVSGKASDRAKQELAALGWRVSDNLSASK